MTRVRGITLARGAVVLCASLLCPSALGAQQRAGSKQAAALRVPDGSVQLDGRLDEAVWQRATPVTDFVQMIVLVAGLAIIAVFAADQAGGADKVIALASSRELFRFLPEPEFKDILFFIGAAITVMFGSIPQQDVFQRITSAKDERTAKLGSLFFNINPDYSITFNGKKASAYAAALVGFGALCNLIGRAFGDDDEPKDLEYKLRQAIGDETMANLLLNGVPAAAGVNLGGKLGMGNVASVLPFTDVDLSSRSGYEKMMVGFMGPFFGGLAPKFVDGAGMIAKGEYYKGLELLAPNGIGNAKIGRAHV